MRTLLLRLAAWGTWVGSAISLIWRWEPARAFLYDRTFRMLESSTISGFVADYGISIVLVALGSWLFWLTGRKSGTQPAQIGVAPTTSAKLEPDISARD